MPETLFRFIRPSFLRGMARSLDLGGGWRYTVRTPRSDGLNGDARALNHDWRMVGADLRNSVEALRREVERGTSSDDVDAA